VHLFYLIGFQNRFLVVTRWTFSFVTHGRGARLISESRAEAAVADATGTQEPEPARARSSD